MLIFLCGMCCENPILDGIIYRYNFTIGIIPAVAVAASINKEGAAAVEAGAVGANERIGPETFVALVEDHREDMHPSLGWRKTMNSSGVRIES